MKIWHFKSMDRSKVYHIWKNIDQVKIYKNLETEGNSP